MIFNVCTSAGAYVPKAAALGKGGAVVVLAQITSQSGQSHRSHRVKNQKEIEAEIKETEESFQAVLDTYPATVAINAPRAMLQLTAKAKLDALYWVLGQPRPHFKCDEYAKTNH